MIGIPWHGLSIQSVGLDKGQIGNTADFLTKMSGLVSLRSYDDHPLRTAVALGRGTGWRCSIRCSGTWTSLESAAPSPWSVVSPQQPLSRPSSWRPTAILS